MKKAEIKVGGIYRAKVSNKLTSVKILRIDDNRLTPAGKKTTHYFGVNLATGREVQFRSAVSFRAPVLDETSPEGWDAFISHMEDEGHDTHEMGITELNQKFDEWKAEQNRATTPAVETVKPEPITQPEPVAVETVQVAENKSVSEKLSEKLKGSTDTAPHLVIVARAGTGKSTTLVEGLKYIKGIPTTITPSEQQQAIWDELAKSKNARSVCFVAFNKSIATELQERVPSGCDAMTMHSMGYKAVTAALGRQEPNNYVVMDYIGEIMGVDSKDLMRERPALVSGTEQLVALCKQNLLEPSEENLTHLVNHYDVELNGDRKDAFELVPKVLKKCLEPKGRINFDDMIWLPVALNLPVRQYDLLIIDELQDLNRCQQMLARKAGKRLIGCGDDKQCLLPGTIITMEGGRRYRIETLVDDGVGERVVTFNPSAGRIAGRRSQGREIQAVSVQGYSGEIVEISAGGNTVSCTTNHRWWVRFSPTCKDISCLYLMEKAGQFRVGICKMQYSCGMGVSSRARSEDADRAWILQVFDSALEARVAEELVSVQNGLPQLVFKNRGITSPDQEFIDAVYSYLGENRDRAVKCLEEFDRDIQFPVWEKKSEDRYNFLSVTKGFVAHACNLIDGCFQFRVDDGSTSGSWEDGKIKRKEYEGRVYGITVEPTERNLRLYLANNIVSHNSIYGFAGADTVSIPRMTEELSKTEKGCVVLPLTVTRRCGKRIVEEARTIVPDFEAHESNPEGKISHAKYTKDTEGRTRSLEATYVPLVQEGNMVLCRVNAPLVSQCLRFLQMGKKASIQGRDIGANLTNLVRKVCGAKSRETPFTPVDQLTSLLYDWADKEITKEQAKKVPSETKLVIIQDKVDCILCFTDGAATAADVIRKIEEVFTDDKTKPGIRLSSIHKAKGLEADRVFFLRPKDGPCPHPMAKSPWEQEQESNLCYVAITRARQELVYVTS